MLFVLHDDGHGQPRRQYLHACTYIMYSVVQCVREVEKTRIGSDENRRSSIMDQFDLIGAQLY